MPLLSSCTSAKMRRKQIIAKELNMTFINRDIAPHILKLSQEYSCLLLTGARQTGKTTLLRALIEEDRNYVTLEDLDERKLAKQEPATFLAVHGPPILIDEVQYAPELFSAIKIAIDNGAQAPFGSSGLNFFPSCTSQENRSLAGWQSCIFQHYLNMKFIDNAKRKILSHFE